jgi:PAS domain S-box-containing protein
MEIVSNIRWPGDPDTYIGNTSGLLDILSHANEVIYFVNTLTFKPVYVNKRTLDILGYSEEEITAMGETWPEKIAHPEDFKQLNIHIKQYAELLPGEKTRVVYRAKDAKGEWCLMETTGLVITLNEETSRNIVMGITRIITDEHHDEHPSHQIRHECRNCKKLLGVEMAQKPQLEIKCNRCGEYNSIRYPIQDPHEKSCTSDTIGI